MAINSIRCVDGNVIKFDYGGLPVGLGQFWSAWDNLDPDLAIRNCVIAGDEFPGGTVTAVTQYNSCYECLVDNYTIVGLEPCDTDIVPLNAVVPISALGFIPTDGQVINAEISINDGRGNFTTYTSCFRMGNAEQVSEDTYINTYEPSFSTIIQIINNNFSIGNGCEECLNGFTSGNESVVCHVCWDGTGYTTTVVTAPHPTYTNQFGQAVVQLDAIQLGGMNGLNN